MGECKPLLWGAFSQEVYRRPPNPSVISARFNPFTTRARGDSLVPLYARGGVSLSLSVDIWFDGAPNDARHIRRGRGSEAVSTSRFYNTPS